MMTDKATKKRGAPMGNQNARKHGFYSKVLTPPQREALPAAASLQGLDQEIAIIRLKILSILANDPRNYEVLLLALSSLSRLLGARQRLEKSRRKTKNKSRSAQHPLRTVVS